MVAATLPGIRRVEHVMGMPIVDRSPRRGRRRGSPGRRVRRVPRGRRALQHLSGRQRDHAHQPRRARDLRDAHPDVREIIERCERAARGDAGLLRRARRLAVARSTRRAREGLVGRPRRRDPRRRGRRATTRSTPAETSGCEAAALPDDCWRVGIQHPTMSDKLAKVVVANDLAIATSGAYARGEHVLDPHTRVPPQGVLSVTITGPGPRNSRRVRHGSLCDGPAGPAWTARLRGYEAMTILADEPRALDARLSRRVRRTLRDSRSQISRKRRLSFLVALITIASVSERDSFARGFALAVGVGHPGARRSRRRNGRARASLVRRDDDRHRRRTRDDAGDHDDDHSTSEGSAGSRRGLHVHPVRVRAVPRDAGSRRRVARRPGAHEHRGRAHGRPSEGHHRPWPRRAGEPEEAVHARLGRGDLEPTGSRPRRLYQGRAARCADRASAADSPGNGQVAKGAILYSTFGCINCHGPNGLGGVPNPSSPDKSIPPLSGADFHHEFNTAAKIRDIVESGSVIGRAPIVSMPHWGGIIPRSDLDALVAYIRTLK